MKKQAMPMELLRQFGAFIATEEMAMICIMREEPAKS